MAPDRHVVPVVLASADWQSFLHPDSSAPLTSPVSMSPDVAMVLSRLQRTPPLAIHSAPRCLAEAAGSLRPANPTQRALAAGCDSPEVPAAPETAAVSWVAADLVALCTHSSAAAPKGPDSRVFDSA